MDVLFYLSLATCAIVLALVFVVTSFKIPSDSMEPTLVAGDRILVDKCSAGARLFDLKAALNRQEVEIHRMPGWRDFRRGDVLVFNFPYPGRWDSIAFDVMLYYVKRCIAVPGDTLEICNARYRVKGVENVPGCHEAQVALEQMLADGRAEDFGIVTRAYPNRREVPWTIGEFGPFFIPRRGSVVPMDSLNVLLYRNAVEWEQKRPLTLRGDTVWLGDSIIRQYAFRENYYFVSGDKLMNSRDSRYWGLLPEEYIVGRAVRVWKSVDPVTGRLRWDRVMKKIE